MNRMTVTDEGDKGPKTSIKMTRAMGEDIGWIALDIMEDIENGDINLKYSRWQWFISNFWNDEVWKIALNKVINMARKEQLDLNKNEYFLDYMFEHISTELNEACKKGTHPIFRQAFMELVTKNKPVPPEPKTVEDLYPD